MDDPMSFFANEASTVKKSVPSAAPVISAPVDELKKVDSSKYAVKGGAKSTKAKESKEDILAREALTSVTSKGLGFGTQIPVNRETATNKAFDILDVAEKNMEKDDSLDTIFASSSSSGSTSNSKSTYATETDGDFLFPTTTPSSNRSTISQGKMRVAKDIENDDHIDDLKVAASFMQKEDEASLNFDLFGKSDTNHAIKKQDQLMTEKIRKVASDNRADGLDEAEADIAAIDSLHVEDEATVKAKNQEKAATAAKQASLLFSQPDVSSNAAPVNVDMASLDLNAYMAANSGDANSGGGLFD